MIICAMRRQKGWWVVLFVTVLFVMAGCADVKPYQPRNHREEGLKGGVFTGPGGEWMIYRSHETIADEEKKKSLDGEQQQSGSEESPGLPKDSQQP
jgi:hypothetical protein